MTNFLSMKTLIPSVLFGSLLTACSTFEPDRYACSSRVTSYAETARATLQTKTNRQPVEVRFNGVSASCYDEGTSVVMELAIGLKVARDTEEGREVSPVDVPIFVATISGDDTVLAQDSFVYTMQFTDGLSVIYPLVRRELKIPQDGRVILNLTPEVIQ